MKHRKTSVTGKHSASAAGRVLNDPRQDKASKTAAASALAQRERAAAGRTWNGWVTKCWRHVRVTPTVLEYREGAYTCPVTVTIAPRGRARK